MSKIIIILILFLVLVGGVVFYQLSNNSMVKTNGKVTVGNQKFDVEVVKTDKDKQIGLTKYKSMRDNQGMLFVFDNPDIQNFWMKNMKFPIDIIFIKDDTIVSVVENAPVVAPKTEPVIYKSDSPVNYVLEVNDGLVKKHNIKQGDKIKIEI